MRYILFMSYTLNITTPAAKQLASLPHKTQQRIRTALSNLASNPFAQGLSVKKLKGREGFRLRVGDYRIIYDLDNQQLIIHVLEADHRQNIY